MGDSYGDQAKGRNFNNARDSGRPPFQGGRGSGNREGGGFRIRLSDNEMKASRSIQEAFNLRSTVAVLGFAIRTLGQMLEEGKLDDIISAHRSQAPHSNRNHSEKKATRNDNFSQKDSRPNPFARPPKPESIQEENDSTVDAIEKDESEVSQETVTETVNEKENLSSETP